MAVTRSSSFELAFDVLMTTFRSVWVLVDSTTSRRWQGFPGSILHKSALGLDRTQPDLAHYIRWGPLRGFGLPRPTGDAGASDRVRIFDRVMGQWVEEEVDCDDFVLAEVYGVTVPVTPPRRLMACKQRLGRQADVEDVRAIGNALRAGEAEPG